MIHCISQVRAEALSPFFEPNLSTIWLRFGPKIRLTRQRPGRNSLSPLCPPRFRSPVAVASQAALLVNKSCRPLAGSPL